MDLTLIAILLGMLEGLTEFLPISSTGHLILATELFGYDAAQWKVFNVVIQLGAILAVIVQYRRTLWAVAVGLTKREAMSIAFVRNILLGFLPAAVLGLLLKDQINEMLGSPLIVAWALVIGGVAILLIERSVKPGGPSGIAQLPMRKALCVGVFQCIAMIPGVSRSGATIMGALLMGVERRTAAEFSFFLAIPTMLGAAVLQLVTHREMLMSGAGPVGWTQIACGFIAAFVVALLVIRAFVAFVSRSGFAPFAWYRIVVGILTIFLLTRMA